MLYHPPKLCHSSLIIQASILSGFLGIVFQSFRVSTSYLDGTGLKKAIQLGPRVGPYSLFQGLGSLISPPFITKTGSLFIPRLLLGLVLGFRGAQAFGCAGLVGVWAV